MTVITQWGMLLHYSCCIGHWRISHKWTAHILPYFMDARVIKRDKMEAVIVFFSFLLLKRSCWEMQKRYKKLNPIQMHFFFFFFQVKIATVWFSLMHSVWYSSININILWCSGIFAGFEHVSIFGYYDCFMVITDGVISDIRHLIFFLSCFRGSI